MMTMLRRREKKDRSIRPGFASLLTTPGFLALIINHDDHFMIFDVDAVEIVLGAKLPPALTRNFVHIVSVSVFYVPILLSDLKGNQTMGDDSIYQRASPTESLQIDSTSGYAGKLFQPHIHFSLLAQY